MEKKERIYTAKESKRVRQERRKIYLKQVSGTRYVERTGNVKRTQ